MIKNNPIQKTILTPDGVKIYYEVDSHLKKDKCLIFLHGLGGDLAAWKVERQALRHNGYSTLAVDLRGHGFSARPDKIEEYNITYFSQDIAAIIQKENLIKPIVVGHCFGGMVTIALAGTYPYLLRAIVLIDTNYKAPYSGSSLIPESLIKNIVLLLGRFLPSKIPRTHVDHSRYIGTWDLDPKRIYSDIMHTSLKSYLFALENFSMINIRDLLKNIIVPTLIIHGRDDIIFPPYLAKELKKRIIHSQFEMIDGNHIVVLNNAPDLIKTMLSFLNRIQ